MGGQSFKCPECGKWFLERGPLRDHLKGKHGYKRPILSFVGPKVTVAEQPE